MHTLTFEDLFSCMDFLFSTEEEKSDCLYLKNKNRDFLLILSHLQLVNSLVNVHHQAARL